MKFKRALEKAVFEAARNNNVSSVLFRNALARKLNLNITDSECLSLLTIKGASTPKELGRYTGLSTGATTAMLDRLEKLSFIHRKPNPSDRRGVIIEVRSEWTQAAGPQVEKLQVDQLELISSYSDEELEVIYDFLRRFAENTSKQIHRIEDN